MSKISQIFPIVFIEEYRKGDKLPIDIFRQLWFELWTVQVAITSPSLRLSNLRTFLKKLWLYEYNYILPRTLENLRAKVFNKVGSLVQFHGPLIHLYGPICKNVGVTTYLHHTHRHGGRSKNLWGQKYLCLFNLEFKHEWSSLRLLVDSKLSKFVNPPLWANL
mgnify:CR=1 FL=1